MRQQRYRYGLSRADFDALLQRQHGACAICGIAFDHPVSARLCVDHDHATGRVRGLLCHSCNVGIGNLGDDEQRLLAAARYLAEHKGAAHAA